MSGRMIMAKKKDAENGEATATAVQKQPSQNGVTRPRPNTKTGRVWEIADELSTSTGKPALRGDVMTAGKAEELNEATIATQFGRWCKFHGISRSNRTKAEKEDAAEVEE